MGFGVKVLNIDKHQPIASGRIEKVIVCYAGGIQQEINAAPGCHISNLTAKVSITGESEEDSCEAMVSTPVSAYNNLLWCRQEILKMMKVFASSLVWFPGLGARVKERMSKEMRSYIADLFKIHGERVKKIG